MYMAWKSIRKKKFCIFVKKDMVKKTLKFETFDNFLSYWTAHVV